MVIKIEEDFCKGCGYCIEICPNKILKESNKLNKRGYLIPEIDNSDNCIYCKKCELICPEMAIKAVKFGGTDAACFSKKNSRPFLLLD